MNAVARSPRIRPMDFHGNIEFDSQMRWYTFLNTYNHGNRG